MFALYFQFYTYVYLRRSFKITLFEINYQFTVEDSKLYSQPWTAELSFYPLEGRIYEYACHEGNYSMPGILAGARRLEREQASN